MPEPQATDTGRQASDNATDAPRDAGAGWDARATWDATSITPDAGMESAAETCWDYKIGGSECIPAAAQAIAAGASCYEAIKGDGSAWAHCIGAGGALYEMADKCISREPVECLSPPPDADQTSPPNDGGLPPAGVDPGDAGQTDPNAADHAAQEPASANASRCAEPGNSFSADTPTEQVGLCDPPTVAGDATAMDQPTNADVVNGLSETEGMCGPHSQTEAQADTDAEGMSSNDAHISTPTNADTSDAQGHATHTDGPGGTNDQSACESPNQSVMESAPNDSSPAASPLSSADVIASAPADALSSTSTPDTSSAANAATSSSATP